LGADGKTLRLAANSDAAEALKSYFDEVGTAYIDSPECQSCASGEVHVVDHLGKIGLGWSKLLVSSGVSTVWSIPFCANGSDRLAGTLTVYSRAHGKPSESALGMTESMAKLAGLVVEHRRLRAELMHNSLEDALTGLPNRRAGVRAIESAIEKASQRKEEVFVVAIDINRFNRINDQYGQEAGDQVLRTVAERLRRVATDCGAVARMGEDEFLVLMPGPVEADDTAEIPRRLVKAISQPIYAGKSKISVSASMGVCRYPQDGVTADTLERHADFAVYRAKSTGEDYCVFSPALSEEASEELEIEEALTTAIEQKLLRLAYQPLYSHEGELTSFEALLRFNHPRLGDIPPSRFIPVAEDTRLILPIGNWVLREACTQLNLWHQAGLPHVRMAVNISALQFARDDFSETVATIVSECNLSPQHLILELTESVVMEDYRAVVRQMNLLRNRGIHIAMDDFGTGYSSLSYIHRIPVDVLKIDRSFIERVAEPEGTRPIVEAVIAMARHLGLDVVAEGVETEEQQNILQQAGCRGFQGFLFAQPLPPDEAETCLRAGRIVSFQGPIIPEPAGGLAVA
jgi:diguanylate cyclase (GGDEF)-like protein